MFGDDDLYTYYELNFMLKLHGKFSLLEIENMYPYELQMYMILLKKHLEEKAKEAEING